MAFMVPLVKNHYDIYARNNPADHRTDNNSLYCSATSLKSGAPVKKQYRLVLTGGKVAGGGKGATKKATGSSKAGLVQTNGKLFYRMPSASISLPVRAASAGARVIPNKAKKTAAAGTEVAVKSNSADSSPQSVSPPSRPLPHVRRTVRNPLTNRVYSYSVSIPDYVAEEDEEDLADEEGSINDDDLDLDSMDLEDKENQAADSHLLLFSTSAPAGTGPIESGTPTPPPSKLASGKKGAKAKPPVQPSMSLPGSPTDESAIPSQRAATQRTHSSTSTSSANSQTNSREYVELLRKFILHIKMLKIGGSSKGSRKSKTVSESSATSDDANNNNGQQPAKPAQRPRKRKDTMEDSKHL